LDNKIVILDLKSQKMLGNVSRRVGMSILNGNFKEDAKELGKDAA